MHLVFIFFYTYIIFEHTSFKQEKNFANRLRLDQVRGENVTGSHFWTTMYMSKSSVFGLHVCRRQYGSNFSQFDVVGSETYRYHQKTTKERPPGAITPFQVIQGHRFWRQWNADIRLTISE